MSYNIPSAFFLKVVKVRDYEHLRNIYNFLLFAILHALLSKRVLTDGRTTKWSYKDSVFFFRDKEPQKRVKLF